MLLDIKRLDYQGRGITFIDGKITFVKNALPLETVELTYLHTEKKYNLAEGKLIKKASNRIESLCPYFGECGGCNYWHVTEQDELRYKQQALQDQFKRYLGYEQPIDFEFNANYSYRNKISLKIVDTKVGFFQEKTHQLIEIDNCLIANLAIQNMIKDLRILQLNNAAITIRSNWNNELLLIINTKEELKIENNIKQRHKIAGIILNGKTVHGENFLFEKVNTKLYKVSYDSFFQVNIPVATKLFQYLQAQIEPNKRILELYCGTGVIGLQLADCAQSVLGIEIVKNAVLNGIFNAELNKIEHIKFNLGDVGKVLDHVKQEFDYVIIDPPRSGLSKIARQVLLKRKIKNLVYISCNPDTLLRDLKELSTIYEIKKVKAFDMFFKTANVETVVLLSHKKPDNHINAKVEFGKSV